MGDEIYILQLYHKVFGKKLNTEVWEWKYNGLSPNKKLIFLAFNNSICIGHYALMPYTLNAKGKDLESYVSLDSMVHPDYQRKGVFRGLVEYANKKYHSLNEPCITFLNENSISIYTKIFDWKYLGNIPVYCRPLSLGNLKNKSKILFFIIKLYSMSINRIFSKSNLLLKEFIQIDKDIESISKGIDYYSISRGLEFFEWRFNKSPYKYKKYKIISNNILIGYCVIKIESKYNLTFVWVMDLFLHKRFEKLYSKVLNTISLFYIDEADFITSLLPNHNYSKYYYKSGFIKIPSFIFPHKFYFCIYHNDNINKNIYKLENWYMTWSLNDVL